MWVRAEGVSVLTVATYWPRRAHSPSQAGRKENWSTGGGGRWHGSPFAQTPPLLGSRAARGGSGWGCPTCRAKRRGGRGGRPQHRRLKIDPHMALIILTTHSWGPGGIFGGKNFFGPKFVFRCLRRQYPFLHKTEGPARKPISPPPTPPFGVRPCRPPRRAIFRSPSHSHDGDFRTFLPPCPSPPQGTTVPPHPGGNRHQVTVPPLGGGGTVHHSRPANSSITQPKIFFSAFGACDFLLISYCSWAK